MAGDLMNIRTVGIVGAGQMGAGIAHVTALAGYEVILSDLDTEVLEHGLQSIRRNLDRQIKSGVVAADEKAPLLKRITTSTHVDQHRGADLVVESAIESFEIKAEIFRQLDAVCPPETLFASNTSSISITRLAAVTSRPDRLVGMHFMNPVPVMRLVEVVRGLETSDAAVSTIRHVAEKLGKTPVECNDHPGFVSNRLLMPMINEAVFAVAEDLATPEAIDQIMTLGMNHPMGPLSLADLIGLDNCLSVMGILHRELGEDKYRPCPLLAKMVDAGRLGRKSGRGFFTYDEG
jgi:3-hydroxybutyryl-CoA dehydrogenase